MCTIVRQAGPVPRWPAWQGHFACPTWRAPCRPFFSVQEENLVARMLARYRTFLQRGSAQESFLINLSDQESRILSSEKAPTWQFCESCSQGSVTGAAKPTVWQFVKFETTNIYQGCWWPVRLPHSQNEAGMWSFQAMCLPATGQSAASHTALQRLCGFSFVLFSPSYFDCHFSLVSNVFSSRWKESPLHLNSTKETYWHPTLSYFKLPQNIFVKCVLSWVSLRRQCKQFLIGWASV